MNMSNTTNTIGSPFSIFIWQL